MNVERWVCSHQNLILYNPAEVTGPKVDCLEKFTMFNALTYGVA